VRRGGEARSSSRGQLAIAGARGRAVQHGSAQHARDGSALHVRDGGAEQLAARRLMGAGEPEDGGADQGSERRDAAVGLTDFILFVMFSKNVCRVSVSHTVSSLPSARRIALGEVLFAVTFFTV